MVTCHLQVMCLAPRVTYSGHRLGTMQLAALSIGSARKVGGLLIDASPNYICTPTFKPSFKRMARFAEFASGNQLQWSSESDELVNIRANNHRTVSRHSLEGITFGCLPRAAHWLEEATDSPRRHDPVVRSVPHAMGVRRRCFLRACLKPLE